METMESPNTARAINEAAGDKEWKGAVAVASRVLRGRWVMGSVAIVWN